MRSFCIHVRMWDDDSNWYALKRLLGTTTYKYICACLHLVPSSISFFRNNFVKFEAHFIHHGCHLLSTLRGFIICQPKESVCISQDCFVSSGKWWITLQVATTAPAILHTAMILSKRIKEWNLPLIDRLWANFLISLHFTFYVNEKTFLLIMLLLRNALLWNCCFLFIILVFGLNSKSNIFFFHNFFIK